MPRLLVAEKQVSELVSDSEASAGSFWWNSDNLICRHESALLETQDALVRVEGGKIVWHVHVGDARVMLDQAEVLCLENRSNHVGPRDEFDPQDPTGFP